MKYEIGNVEPSEIKLTLDKAMKYGSIPEAMMMVKSEETYLGNEGGYEDFARHQLMNWGETEKTKFEYEEPGVGNRNYGRLDLQYGGERGLSDIYIYRPEQFYGFGSLDGDTKQRDVNKGPNLELYVNQWQDRMRFQSFNPTMCKQETGGMIPAAQAIRNNQTIFKIVRDRLKVFDHMLDGRREGLRRPFELKSRVPKQLRTHSYGEYIRDWALNPDLKTRVVCREIICNTKEFRENTHDADMKTAKYTQGRRRQANNFFALAENERDGAQQEFTDGDKTKTYRVDNLTKDPIGSKRQSAKLVKNSDLDWAVAQKNKTRSGAPNNKDLNNILASIDQGTELTDGNNAQTYRAASILMRDLIECKRQANKLVENSDLDWATAQKNKTRKMAPYVEDLNIILSSIRHETDLADGDDAHNYTTKTPEMSHLARQIKHNHSLPAHHYLNAILMFRSLMPGSTRKIKNDIITDANAPEIQDSKTIARKAAALKILTGSKLNRAEDHDKAESFKTMKYKSARIQQNDNKKDKFNGEKFMIESDLTQQRSKNHKNYEITGKDVADTQIKFNDNTSKDRNTGSMGTKYMRHHMDDEPDVAHDRMVDG